VVDADIGIVKSLWRLQDHEMLPVLGVCLGMQSLAVECGASIHRLRVVKHGQLADIIHRGKDLFQGIGAARVVRYHSLYVKLENNGDLEELAFAQDGAENGHVTMAIRHKLKPYWASLG
jgi:para-aminobenzoate synthetase